MALSEIQFDVSRHAEGVRIYARHACETIGALDAQESSEGSDKTLAVTVVYVVPRWRDRGIASAMLECFNEYRMRVPDMPAQEAVR